VRRPSDRAALWRRYRARIGGARLSWSPEEIECGRYKAKRRGQFVAVQIDIEGEVDDDGELISDERFVAFIYTAHTTNKVEGEKVFDVWSRCGGRPITDEEFRTLAGLPSGIDLRRDVIT